jgi:hypothetical protein
LDFTAKGRRDDFFQARCRAACGPMEDHIAPGLVACPKIAKLRFAMAGRQIADGRFIDLHITRIEHMGSDLLVNGLEPIRRQSHPLRHRLPRKPNLVARPVDRLLPVKGTMLRSKSDGGSGAVTGVASSVARCTYVGRTVRRRRN